MTQHISAFIPVVALATLIISAPVWDIERRTWGIVILLYAATYGIASFALYRSERTRPFAVSHVIAAIFFFTICLFVLFENEALVLAISFEAMILHAVAWRFNEERAFIGGHLVSAIVVLLMAGRFLTSQPEIFNPVSIAALTNLVVLICGFLISRLLPDSISRTVYAVALHIGTLLWFAHEFIPAENGQALISISWGVYAVILLVFGLRTDSVLMRRLALVTLALIVGKLFLVDLERLEMIWRVILFMGFGAGFLVLSFLFQTLRKTDDQGADQV